MNGTGDQLRRYGALAGPGIAEPRSKPVAWWGMALLIATEAALFASLIAAYYYLRWFSDAGWPPSGVDPKLLRPILFTAALVLSSGTMAIAQVGIRRGRQGLLKLGLVLTMLLALTFIGLQAWDLAEKTNEFVPQTDAYGSIVYTLIGAHAAHVVAGTLILAWVGMRALRGAYTAAGHVGISVAALYWHFVVALAVIVFVVVVLTPYW
ncbi:MAG TPA: cytochrome c oxidase subunit 3 [Solirubrobacterales bacterium]|nr:cytochrome c oxidase subunit 3 [Solirubrobacterales bacterium]